MNNKDIPVTVVATEVAPRQKISIYPEPFASQMNGREKRVLGDFFGLVNFGVNLTKLWLLELLDNLKNWFLSTEVDRAPQLD